MVQDKFFQKKSGSLNKDQEEHGKLDENSSQFMQKRKVKEQVPALQGSTMGHC